MAEHVHLLLVKPVVVHNRAGKEGAHHEVQTRPVRSESHEGEPDQAHVPAVHVLEVPHELPEKVSGNTKADHEDQLTAEAVPIQQDQGKHAPDGDVVHAGVAQDALADRLTQDVQLFHQ